MKIIDKTIHSLLKKADLGLTITEIVIKSRYSRSTVRTILAEMRGANQLKIREVGMAKLHSLK